MKQHHVNQKQFSAVNNKQSELNKAGIQNTSQDFAPLAPFPETPFLKIVIYAFANFVWDYLSLQFSPSSTLFEISTGIKSRGAREMDC